MTRSVVKLGQISAMQREMVKKLASVEEWDILSADSSREVISKLENFVDANMELTHTQKALLNILEDYSEEKKLAEASQRALVNILEDYRVENARVEKMNIKLSASNKELEQFAYIASHDLQEPLRTIMNFSGLLKNRYNNVLDGDAEEFMNYISEAATRMQTLIKDLLIYSRIGKDENKVPIDCNTLLQEILMDMDQSISESSTEIQAGHLPTISGNHVEMKSLFQNLISNAIKYRSANTYPEIHIAAHAQGREWLFSIRDNGIGIDKIYFDKLFIIFQRLHNKDEYPGTGIGLAHCKKIVEQHNGKIWVESEPGKGSTFFFTIPS